MIKVPRGNEGKMNSHRLEKRVLREFKRELVSHDVNTPMPIALLWPGGEGKIGHDCDEPGSR